MDTESQVSGQIGGYYSTEYHLPEGQVSRAQAGRFCFEGWIFTVKRIKHQRNKKQGWFRLIQKPQDYSSFLLKSLLSQCTVCQLIQLFIRALSVVTIFSGKKKLCLTDQPLYFSWISKENIYILLNPKWKENLEKPCPVLSIQLTFLANSDKMLDTASLKKEGTSAHSLRVSTHGFHQQPIKTGKARAGAWGGWSHDIHSKEAERERNVTTEIIFSILSSLGFQSMERGYPHSKWVFTSLSNISGNIQRHISKVNLNVCPQIDNEEWRCIILFAVRGFILYCFSFSGWDVTMQPRVILNW